MYVATDSLSAGHTHKQLQQAQQRAALQTFDNYWDSGEQELSMSIVNSYSYDLLQLGHALSKDHSTYLVLSS